MIFLLFSILITDIYNISNTNKCQRGIFCAWKIYHSNSSKIYYFDFNFNIYIDFFEIKNSNEIILWLDFGTLFWLLISLNYKILILSIQKIDFIISEINNHIYWYKKIIWMNSFGNIDISSIFQTYL